MKPPYRLLSTAAAGLLLSTVVIAVHAQAGVGPSEASAGAGAAVTRVVDVRALSDASKATPARTAPVRLDRGASLPALPSTGYRLPAGTSGQSSGGPNARSNQTAAPAVAPGIVANFEGTNEADGCGACQPSDVNAAVGVSEVMQMVSLRFAVFTKTGDPVCDVGLQGFVGTDDVLSDPRVLYDNVNHRYLIAMTVIPTIPGATPALWAGSTSDDEACGLWNLARITFTGTAFPGGTTLSYPVIGQDRNALLVATDNLTPGGENFTAFAIPKAALFAGGSFNVPAFATASRTAPVSNGGIPMISTTFSYFVGAVPNAGYRLYRMANSGGPNTTLTLQASILAPFSAPSRRVNQPGTGVTLDPLDGRIAWSPVNDGNFIWFAHGISLSGFPTVRYGAIGIAANSITVAVAYHSNTSDDFNPSIGVGNNPGGGNYIYVNWAYTDTLFGVPTSVTVDSVSPHNGVPNLVGTGAVVASGSRTTTETAFGAYSSVAIDPTVTAGSCGVAAQQLFASTGTWRTRVVRVGRC